MFSYDLLKYFEAYLSSYMRSETGSSIEANGL